jgi:hypothetical protein
VATPFESAVIEPKEYCFPPIVIVALSNDFAGKEFAIGVKLFPLDTNMVGTFAEFVDALETIFSLFAVDADTDRSEGKLL